MEFEIVATKEQGKKEVDTGDTLASTGPVYTYSQTSTPKISHFLSGIINEISGKRGLCKKANEQKKIFMDRVAKLLTPHRQHYSLTQKYERKRREQEVTNGARSVLEKHTICKKRRESKHLKACGLRSALS